MGMEYRRVAVKDLYLDIGSVTTGSRSSNRFALADVYQVTLSAEGFFPKKPLSLRSTVPANLRHKVSNGCPLCPDQSVMDGKVSAAKSALTEYRRALKAWLEENGVALDEQGEPIKLAVKDLDSTLKIKAT